MPLLKSFLSFQQRHSVYNSLLQQVIILEVIDLHGFAHIGEGGGGGLFGHGAAGFQDLDHLGQALLPLLSRRAKRS